MRNGERDARALARGRRWIGVCALLLFLGINLRTVILAVPPILPVIQRDLRLSYAATGLLASLPLLLMAGAAWPAGLLAARLGGRTMVGCGLALLALGAMARALVPGAALIYVCTVVLGVGIALAQTAVPLLVAQWYPRAVGLVSALFTDGLIVGEALAAALTAPLLAHVLGADAWRASFVVWGAPVAVALALWLWLAPAAPATHRLVTSAVQALPPPAPSGAARAAAAPRRASALHLGILLGSGSLVFFGMNNWIAPYNLAVGRAALTPLALGVLNLAQLPVSLGVTVFAQRLVGRRWPFTVAGACALLALGGWLWAPAALEPLWAAVLGGSSAMVFTLGIALPALLATGTQVARLAGAMLTLSYGLAFAGPIVGGALWDALRVPQLALLPVACAGGVLLALGALLPARAPDAARHVPAVVR